MKAHISKWSKRPALRFPFAPASWFRKKESDADGLGVDGGDLEIKRGRGRPNLDELLAATDWGDDLGIEAIPR
jgi:hypothetical protein